MGGSSSSAGRSRAPHPGIDLSSRWVTVCSSRVSHPFVSRLSRVLISEVEGLLENACAQFMEAVRLYPGFKAAHRLNADASLRLAALLALKQSTEAGHKKAKQKVFLLSLFVISLFVWLLRPSSGKLVIRTRMLFDKTRSSNGRSSTHKRPNLLMTCDLVPSSMRPRTRSRSKTFGRMS